MEYDSRGRHVSNQQLTTLRLLSSHREE